MTKPFEVRQGEREATGDEQEACERMANAILINIDGADPRVALVGMQIACVSLCHSIGLPPAVFVKWLRRYFELTPADTCERRPLRREN